MNWYGEITHDEWHELVSALVPDGATVDHIAGLLWVSHVPCSLCMPHVQFRAADEVMVTEHHSQKNYAADGVEQYIIVTILPMSFISPFLD